MRDKPAKLYKFWQTLVLSVGIALTTTDLQAEVIPPIGLAPGSQYQLMFVTTGTIDATSAEIDDYNAFVYAEAALNPLLPAATWRAVVSTAATDAHGTTWAYDNAPWQGLPIYNTQGMLVTEAENSIYSGGPILSPPRFSQFGLPVPNTPNPDPVQLPQYDSVTRVWTGGGFVGPFDSSLTLLGGPAFSYGYGIPEGTEATSALTGAFLLGGVIWSIVLDEEDNPLRDSNENYPVYALSGPITVPVPEPNALVLSGLAIIALFSVSIFRRRILTATSTGQ